MRTRLNHVPGEVKVMETEWKLPMELQYDFRKMYVGEGKEFDLNKEDQKLNHPHRVQDKDEEGFWDDILAYLHLGKLPKAQTESDWIQQKAWQFFLKDGILWRKNGSGPPLMVVLNPKVRERIARNAHDEAGHRGRDLTYQKIHDSYWWPNQYISVATYCQSCHECQMRSTY